MGTFYFETLSILRNTTLHSCNSTRYCFVWSAFKTSAQTCVWWRMFLMKLARISIPKRQFVCIFQQARILYYFWFVFSQRVWVKKQNTIILCKYTQVEVISEVTHKSAKPNLKNWSSSNVTLIVRYRVIKNCNNVEHVMWVNLKNFVVYEVLLETFKTGGATAQFEDFTWRYLICLHDRYITVSYSNKSLLYMD